MSEIVYFKVGDRVRALKDDDTHAISSGWKAGQEFEVVDTDGYDEPTIIDNDGHVRLFIASTRFELVEPTPEPSRSIAPEQPAAIRDEPAFPFDERRMCDNPIQHPGMSLRDYFAIHASDRDISAHSGAYDVATLKFELSREAGRYAFADAMLAERAKGGGA